jgi:hypothetical protein
MSREMRTKGRDLPFLRYSPRMSTPTSVAVISVTGKATLTAWRSSRRQEHKGQRP